MTVPSLLLRSHHRRSGARAAAHSLRWGQLGLLAGAGLMGGSFIACGSSGESDDGTIPTFGVGGNSGTGVGGAATGPTGAAGSANVPACTPGSAGCTTTPEAMNPNTPIDQTPTTPITGSCTPNAFTCNGNVLNHCDATGSSSTPQDCAATGATCGQVAGVPACVAANSCTPGVAECATANTVSTCGAGGGTPVVTRCPDGTNCTGAGQCTPVSCNANAMLSSDNGGVTVYWFNQGTYSNPRQPEQDINCSFGSDGSSTGTGQQDRVFNIPDEQLFGAINGTDYANSATCGACVEMVNRSNNRMVTITVVDSCLVGNNNPTCTQGHIDLSRTAFEQLTGQNTGDINNISWRFVPCAGDTGVQFQLKKPDDMYWNQFIVLNHRYPIAKAEVEMEPGRWVEARRESYNYWLPSEGGNGEGGDMGTYRVRVTDVNGAIIEEQLELRGGLQGGNGQFACQM
jgi:expansin (peptidoglycan-binding protein)